MQQLIVIIHSLICLALISLVLLQHGKGADVGASFGSGAANTMFGSVGPASFLMKLTGVFAFIFFVTAILLTCLGARQQPAVAGFDMPVQQTMPMPKSMPSNSFVPAQPMTTPNTSRSLETGTQPATSPSTKGT